jgi:hypothetical protein
MEHTRTITRDFDTGDTAVLHVEARSGAVIVQSSQAPRVRVEAVVHVWSDLAEEADEAASLVARGIEQDAHRVIVRAPSLPQTEGWSLWGGKRGSRVDYSVVVPIKTAVRVLSRSGRVQVEHTEGRVHVECASGRCSVEDVSGEVTVQSRSGSITVQHVRGNVKAEARSGRIDLRMVAGDAALEARSGAIEVHEVSGDLTIVAHTCSLLAEDVGGRLYARSHTGAVRYRGKVHADVDIKAHTGSIHLAVDPDFPFFIDAESQTGSVRSDLPPRRGPATSANGTVPKVRLRTHTGSIRLSRL